MASSFEGEAGLPKFKSEYNRLLDTLEKVSPGIRVVLFSPVPHQRMPAPNYDPAQHNSQIRRYSDAIAEIAQTRHLRFISLLKELDKQSGITEDGIHLNSNGYKLAARKIEKALFGSGGKWIGSAQTETLRQAIVRKNEWFFHRSRPENMAYIFGFRKGEQGRNSVEIPRFDPLIAEEEARIAQLRSLKSGVVVPEIPRRVGNLTAKHTEQPLPSFTVADGLEVTLWAENPLLNKPIQMNFDPKGRLWVASSEVYPQIEPGQKPTDKIIVLEDTTGEGKADKATIFAEDLLIPTGVEPGDGGCYVAQSTELLFFKDSKGKGKADSKRTVLSGFGTEDVHHNLHTLRWGLDGRLYLNQSIYTRTDTETPQGVIRLKGGGVFRFEPRNQQMSILFKGWCNPWGHQFDDFGQSFVTDGAGGAGINFGIPGASYFTAPNAPRTLESVSPGSYPKFCSIEIIRSEQFPQDWQGDVITCDFRAHRIVRFKMSEQGAGYITQEMPDVLRSTADTFRPIDLKMGPDGALYVADWSNPIIQHGEVDFRDPRRDKEHGRIWRISSKGHPLLPRKDFTQMKNTALLNELLSPNAYDRQQAKRVLVERGAGKVKKDLNAWTKLHSDESARIQALWMFEALNAGPLDKPSQDLASELLRARDGRIRAAAVRAISDGVETIANPVQLLEPLAADAHPRVRLETVRALGRVHTAAAASLALTVLDKPMDNFLDYGLWLTINELSEPWLASVESGQWKTEGRDKQLEFAIKSIDPARSGDVVGRLVANHGIPGDGSGPWIEIIGGDGGGKELRHMYDQLLKGGFVESAALRAMTALGNAARLRNALPEGDLSQLGSLLKSDNEKLRLGALHLAGDWKLASVSQQLLEIAGAANSTTAERDAAFAALHDIGGAGTIQQLQKLIGATETPAVRRVAVLTLAKLDFGAALPDMGKVFKSLENESDSAAVWHELLSIKGSSAKLSESLASLDLSPDAARVGARVARESNRSPGLVEGLMKAAGLTLSDKKLTDADMMALAKEALAKGDPTRGERVYRRSELACMSCHGIGGVGGKVGPDLTSIGASAQADYLVESLIYPNAKIKEGFHSTSITTKDDQEINGIVIKENDKEVVLRNAANQEISVAKNNIATRANGGSLMPSGLVDGLLPEERLDLIKFLSSLGRPGPFDAAKGGVARLWRFYLATSQNAHLGIEGVIQGDFKRTGWMVIPSLVNGDLPKDLCVLSMPSRGGTRGLFAATQFQSAKGGQAKLNLECEAQDAWLNGVPVKVGPTFVADLKPGINTLVLQFDAEKLSEKIKLSSGDVSFLTN